jgi:hypothetical protein
MMSRVPVSEADFLLQGRVQNYREPLTELLAELDGLMREVMERVNQEQLGGAGAIRYSTRPPAWTLAWRTKEGAFEANLIAFAHGGAWIVQGRMGLDRPFRADPQTRPTDADWIRREIQDQIATDVPII